jgi:hypothetical protein
VLPRQDDLNFTANEVVIRARNKPPREIMEMINPPTPTPATTPTKLVKAVAVSSWVAYKAATVTLLLLAAFGLWGPYSHH